MKFPMPHTADSLGFFPNERRTDKPGWTFGWMLRAGFRPIEAALHELAEELRVEVKGTVFELSHRVDRNLWIEVEVVPFQNRFDILDGVSGDAGDFRLGAASDGEPHYGSPPEIMERAVFDAEPIALPLEGGVKCFFACPWLALRVAEDFRVSPSLGVGPIKAGSSHHGDEDRFERTADGKHYPLSRLVGARALQKLTADELAIIVRQPEVDAVAPAETCPDGLQISLDEIRSSVGEESGFLFPCPDLVESRTVVEALDLRAGVDVDPALLECPRENSGQLLKMEIGNQIRCFARAVTSRHQFAGTVCDRIAPLNKQGSGAPILEGFQRQIAEFFQDRRNNPAVLVANSSDPISCNAGIGGIFR